MVVLRSLCRLRVRPHWLLLRRWLGGGVGVPRGCVWVVRRRVVTESIPRTLGCGGLPVARLLVVGGVPPRLPLPAGPWPCKVAEFAAAVAVGRLRLLSCQSTVGVHFRVGLGPRLVV